MFMTCSYGSNGFFTNEAVWMDLIKMKAQISTMKEPNFLAVFSQRNAMRLNRLILPIVCSIRARPL
jgi:hypothetical protein